MKNENSKTVQRSLQRDIYVGGVILSNKLQSYLGRIKVVEWRKIRTVNVIELEIFFDIFSTYLYL